MPSIHINGWFIGLIFNTWPFIGKVIFVNYFQIMNADNPIFRFCLSFLMNSNVQIVYRFVGKYLSCNITDFGRNTCEMNCNFKSEFSEYLLCTLHIQLCVCNNHCSCCCYLLIRMSSSDMEFVQCNPKTCMSFSIVIHPLALKDQHLYWTSVSLAYIFLKHYNLALY